VAVTFRSKSEITGSGTSPTPTEPAGATAGDALIALYLTDAGAAPTLPGGWTSLYNGTQGTVTWRVGYIIRGGSAPSYAFTHTGSVYREVHVVCLQGAATLTLDSQSATGTSGTSTHNPDPPSTTAVQTTSLAVAGGINYGAVGAWSASAGYTIRSLNSGGIDGAIETKSLSASGAENPAAMTMNQSGDYWDGFTVTFTDTAGGGGATIGGPCFDGRTFRGLTHGRVLSAPLSREARMMAEADRLWQRDRQLRRAA
jgi:hypothetical protein